MKTPLLTFGCGKMRIINSIIFVMILLVAPPGVWAASWSAYVLDNSSIGINLANVTAVLTSNDDYVNSTLTDAAGFFKVSIPDSTSVTLVSSKSGYLNDTSQTLPPIVGDFVLPFNITLLLDLPGNITGRVTDNVGNGIANAIVDAIQGGITKGSDIANINGDYLITNLRDGTYTVKITKDTITQNITNVVVLSGSATAVNFSVILDMDNNFTAPSGNGGGDEGDGGDGYGCVTEWICDDWGECIGGVQTRTCNKERSYCSAGEKPHETQTCTYTEIKPVPEIPEQLLDVKLELVERIIPHSRELTALINFENFGTEPVPVSLTYTILNEFGEEVYSERGYVIVYTEKAVIKRFDNLVLNPGQYKLVLRIEYGDNIIEEFKQNFEVKEGIIIDYFVYSLLGTVAIIILLFFLLLLFLEKIDYSSKSKSS